MAKKDHRQSKIPPVIKHMLYTVDVGSHKRLIGSLGTRWGSGNINSVTVVSQSLWDS